MATSKVKYLGELRTLSVHLKSNSELISDAPTDNQGKGQAFSPSDTVATALASCMITIMGIKANEHDWDITGSHATVTKIMTSNPRAIGEIQIQLEVKGVKDDEKAKTILKNAAINCPVAKSLSANINQVIKFDWV
ncbi:MAG: OsmC family protein [Bacteroidetes bacterium]|nr:OsmC family protein [Bacteroidota bacterium]